MGSENERADTEDRKVTFLGRGLALRSPTRLTLLVCPLCSQRNGERTAELGTCAWCGYEPAERDERPCGAETQRSPERGERAGARRLSCTEHPPCDPSERLQPSPGRRAPRKARGKSAPEAAAAGA